MGLFSFFKKNQDPKKQSTKFSDEQREMTILNKVDSSYRKSQAELNYQNELLSRVNTAREKYKKDGDLESAIKEYEYVFIESNPPCTTSQDIDLANLYIKAGAFDKAWAYLNQLMLRRKYPDPDIRFYQARILKKEEKFAYAVEMYAIGYYYKSIPNMPFQTEKFQKDISSSVKKLGWSQEKIDGILRIIMAFPHGDNSAESDLVKLLREYINE